MILKLKRSLPSNIEIDGHKAWEFIDNITKCTKEIQGMGDDTTFIYYEKNGESISQMVDDEAYLLNDKGQTIERLI